MATFDQLESSVESSRPIEVYTFTLGTEVFRYTSAEDDINAKLDALIREVRSLREKVQELELKIDALGEAPHYHHIVTQVTAVGTRSAQSRVLSLRPF